MDHTIVGDVGDLQYRYMLETQLQWPGAASHANGPSVQEIAHSLRNGLLRPGFQELATYLHSTGCLIAIYTYSLRPWADRMILAIEEVLGFSFITPGLVFDRTHCNRAASGSMKNAADGTTIT